MKMASWKPVSSTKLGEGINARLGLIYGPCRERDGTDCSSHRSVRGWPREARLSCRRRLSAIQYLPKKRGIDVTGHALRPDDAVSGAAEAVK
jgi:hypothetical protein